MLLHDIVNSIKDISNLVIVDVKNFFNRRVHPNSQKYFAI